MKSPGRAGRPKASSRETLAEAACELFLERGYDATSIADITQRVGVSRSSFFNYFASKSDVLWSGLDARIADAETALAALGTAATEAAVHGILVDAVHDFAPDPLALALRNAAAMGLEGELVRDASIRSAQLATAVSEAVAAAGAERITAEIVGAAYAAAVLAALRAWAAAGAGRSTPDAVLRDALAVASGLRWPR